MQYSKRFRVKPGEKVKLHEIPPALNSEVNRRRDRLPFVVCMLDILSAFRIVSTQSGEAHEGVSPPQARRLSAGSCGC